MSYVALPVTVDPDQLADDAVTYLQDNIPGWEPADGHLETWLIEAIARMTSEAAQVAADVPSAIFAQFGAQFLGITQETGTPATVTTTWTAQDNAGYTIPAGTVVAYKTSGDTGVLFEVTTDAVITAGSTSVGGVTLTAVATGEEGNGVPASVGLEMVDALSYIDTVVTSSVSSGGVDAETDADYLDRLATELQLLTPRPILPEDFAILAGRVAGVHRALGISGYNPDDDTTGNERYVTVALADEDGQPVDPAVATAVETYLDGLREVNFVVKTMDPEYTTINVTFTIHVLTGYTAADVVDLAEATVTEALSPAVFAGGTESPPVWNSGQNKIRYLAMSALIAAVPGVDYVASLSINAGTADITMTGQAPLPESGTISGSAV